jgi:hypothetical protein
MTQHKVTFRKFLCRGTASPCPPDPAVKIRGAPAAACCARRAPAPRISQRHSRVLSPRTSVIRKFPCRGTACCAPHARRPWMSQHRRCAPEVRAVCVPVSCPVKPSPSGLENLFSVGGQFPVARLSGIGAIVPLVGCDLEHGSSSCSVSSRSIPADTMLKRWAWGGKLLSILRSGRQGTGRQG